MSQDPLVDAKRGDRIFQEGTKVGDEYCILSIYDDPGSAILNCTAYDPMQAETLNCAISYAELEGLMSADKATIICDQVADHRCAWLSTHLELVHTEESRSLRVTAHPKPCVQAQAPMRTRAELQELEERRNEQIAAKKDAATRALLAGLARTKHAKEQHDLDRSSRIEIGRAARKAVHERLKRESEELARKEAEREALREMRIAEKELERRQRELAHIRGIPIATAS